MDTYITSDLHFGHGNIIAYSGRPYDSVDEMNEALIANWNETVGDNDEVIVAGDFAMGRRAETVPLARRLNGRKKLIPGNHDVCWPGHRKVRPRDLSLYTDAGFEILDPEVPVLVNGEHVTVCHFPYEGDSHDSDRFQEWRPKDRGEWLLHGHVHEKWLVNGRQINVGVDVWDYRPVPIEWIADLIKARRGG